jgi:serralysin
VLYSIENVLGTQENDTITGGTGVDSFVFLSVNDSPVADRVDGILDFNPDEDRIDLSAIDADTTHG